MYHKSRVGSVVKMLSQMVINKTITTRELYDCLNIIEEYKIQNNIQEVNTYVKADDKNSTKDEKGQE